jgi:DNA primase
MERYGKSFKVKKEKYKKPKFELKLNEFTNKLPEYAFRYLDDRKIFDAPFLSEDAEFLYDEKTNRLVIPWYLDDKVVYYQKRTLDEKQQPKYLFPFGVDKSVYNIDRVDPAFPYIFVLEGALDSIYVYNGVAIGGKNITKHQRDLIKSKFPKHKIVYFLDNHHNESAMRTHLLGLADKEPSSSFLLFPDAMKDIKDVNQWIVAGGLNMFEHSKWLEKNILSSLKLKFKLSSSK